MVLIWITYAWLDQDMIRWIFKKCGISLALDDSENRLLSIDRFSDSLSTLCPKKEQVYNTISQMLRKTNSKVKREMITMSLKENDFVGSKWPNNYPKRWRRNSSWRRPKRIYLNKIWVSISIYKLKTFNTIGAFLLSYLLLSST